MEIVWGKWIDGDKGPVRKYLGDRDTVIGATGKATSGVDSPLLRVGAEVVDDKPLALCSLASPYLHLSRSKPYAYRKRRL